MKKLLLGLGGVAVSGGIGFQLLADEQQKRDVEGLTKSCGNAVRAGRILGRCVYAYVYELRGIEYNSDEYIKERAKCAKRVLHLSETNRGIYLKAGQYIGNLERIMPREWTDVLKVLQDSGPSLPFDEIRVVVDHDTKKPLEQIFESFDEKAIAAASLAQVHKAKLKNGPEVAVKLQFPSLRTQTAMDMVVIKYIAKFVNQMLRWNDYKNIDLVKNYETFRGALTQELDFKNEVKNAEKTREIFKNSPQIHVPKNYIELSNDRMIVQEFMTGAKINDKEGIEKLGLDPVECAKLLVDTFAQMIFKYGHIHCDAHPGNLFIRPMKDNSKKPQLVILDHGFYRELSQEFRLKYSDLWVSLISFEYDRVKTLSYELGVNEFYKYLPLVLLFRTMGSKQKLGAPLSNEERKYLREKDIVNFEKINQFMNSLPPEMLFIIRASNLIAIHNAVLGNTTRYRLMRFTDLAFTNVVPGAFSRIWAKFKFYIRIFLFEAFPSLYKSMYSVAVDE